MYIIAKMVYACGSFRSMDHNFIDVILSEFDISKLLFYF
jgi:hypothetical protein